MTCARIAIQSTYVYVIVDAGLNESGVLTMCEGADGRSEPTACVGNGAEAVCSCAVRCIVIAG